MYTYWNSWGSVYELIFKLVLLFVNLIHSNYKKCKKNKKNPMKYSQNWEKSPNIFVEDTIIYLWWFWMHAVFTMRIIWKKINIWLLGKGW